MLLKRTGRAIPSGSSLFETVLQASNFLMRVKESASGKDKDNVYLNSSFLLLI